MTVAATTSSVPRSGLRRPDDPLARASIGVVPIPWNNADCPDLTPFVPADVVLGEIARLGFEGTQAGIGYPEGPELAAELGRRGLRLAEVYAALPCGPAGPAPDALDAGRDRLRALVAAGGDVLVVALDLSPGRQERAGRAAAPGTPRLPDAVWDDLARILETLAAEAEAAASGRRVAFHQHAGTYVETPDELDRLLAALDRAAAPGRSRVGICLDVGHYTVGGGDPVDALRRYGERVTHVHLKDVDPDVLADLRAGRLGGFLDALRARIYTELGAGVLDLAGVLTVLAARDYAGWLMVEQDTTWTPPSEAMAIARRVLDYAIRHTVAVERAEPAEWRADG